MFKFGEWVVWENSRELVEVVDPQILCDDGWVRVGVRLPNGQLFLLKKDELSKPQEETPVTPPPTSQEPPHQKNKVKLSYNEELQAAFVNVNNKITFCIPNVDEKSFIASEAAFCNSNNEFDDEIGEALAYKRTMEHLAELDECCF